jgi:hypothetical protein
LNAALIADFKISWLAKKFDKRGIKYFVSEVTVGWVEERNPIGYYVSGNIVSL